MNNKALLKYHSICSLIAGSFLILLGITGSILVFNKNIDTALFQKFEAADAPEAFNLDAAVVEIQKKYKDWSTRIVHFKKGETFIFNIRRPEARKLIFVHPHTGKIIGEVDERSHFTKWILKLHYSLHSGIIGKFIVFITGILFFISLITGVLLYRKNILKTLLFKVKLKKKKKRLFYSVLHRYIGTWALLLNLILAFTGIFLGYKVAVAGLNKSTPPTPPIVEASLEEALQDLKIKFPDFSPEYIRFPSSEKRNISINGAFKKDPFYYSIYYNNIQFNYKTGEIMKVIKIADESLTYRFNSSILPLHYGQFAGIIGKLLYALIGLSGPALSITGFYIWYKKKHKKKLKAIL